MGLCGSSLSEEERVAKKRTKELDRANEEAFRLEQEKIKLLLLGAGESGKSTIFKQMKVLYGIPMSDEERMQYTPVVYNNTVTAMKILCEQVDALGLRDQIRATAALERFSAVSDEAEIDPDLGATILELWQDPGILAAWERRAQYQIVESVQYYFDAIDRIMQPEYMATQQDILLCRVRTSGIVEEKYIIDDAQFVMYDVGGQRNERKKWIHCFDDVTAVIFVAALSEYDQTLYEDATTNRMVEAVDLFDEICNNRFFENSSMILFLNKKDLFEKKIKKIDIKSVKDFEDYQGDICTCGHGYPNDEEECTCGMQEMGKEYFLALFLAVNNDEDKATYHHLTCATDTSNVKHVFNACKDIILKNNLRGSGFME
mmetsp:Transcript_18450/g.36918  ORF Transcript_18450/g.36918 Transcript_18450/m.36918 type:complete len:373 (-) Transcript_18450:80-1198(-)